MKGTQIPSCPPPDKPAGARKEKLRTLLSILRPSSPGSS